MSEEQKVLEKRVLSSGRTRVLRAIGAVQACVGGMLIMQGSTDYDLLVSKPACYVPAVKAENVAHEKERVLLKIMDGGLFVLLGAYMASRRDYDFLAGGADEVQKE